MASRWWADDGPLLVVFGSSLSPHQLKQEKRRRNNVVRIGPPLTKLSESAHGPPKRTAVAGHQKEQLLRPLRIGLIWKIVFFETEVTSCACADPERFVRECTTLVFFRLMRGGRIQIPLLTDHHRPASEPPLRVHM